MPVTNNLRRLMLQTIVDNINELTIGFDGTPATPQDGSAGRPALTVVPTVTIIDENAILLEANIPVDKSFSESIKEVYIQYRGTSDFTPIARFNTRPITKNNSNEINIQIVLEVI